MIKELKDLDFRNMIVMNDLGYQPDEYDRKEAAIEMADEKQMPVIYYEAIWDRHLIVLPKTLKDATNDQ
jgi:hypothetical protein